jgi:MFS family permease
MAFLSCLLVLSLWVVPYLPTNDGPESVFAVHMENHYSDPGTVYREYFAPALQFAGRGFTLLFGPIEDIWGWRVGLRIALSVIVLVEAWGAALLIHVHRNERAPLSFLAFPFALAWQLYMGFFAFALTSGLALFLVSFVRWAPRIGRGTEVAVALLLLLLGVSHVFAGLLAAVLIVAVLVARDSPDRGRLLALGSAALVCIPLLCLLGSALWVARQAASGVAFSHGLVLRSLSESLATLPPTLLPGPRWRALVVALVAVVSLLLSAMNAAKRRSEPVDVAFIGLAALFLALSVFSPLHLPGWQCFAQRFAFLGLTLVLVSAPFERLSGRVRVVASTALFLVSTSFLLVSVSFHLRLASSVEDVVAALDAPVHRSRLILPVTLEPAGPPPFHPGDHEIPYWAPLSHIGALFATAHGGMSAYTFASNSATWSFVYRDDASALPPIPSIERYMTPMATDEFISDESLRRSLEEDLATFATRFDGIALTAARPSDVHLWLERGFVPDWQGGRTLLAHFARPSPVSGP